MALSHIGKGDEIQNYVSDTSAEATACRRFMDNAIESVLGDFEWPFASKFVTLDMVEKDPTPDWGFSYRYPPDCLTFKRFVTGDRVPTNDNVVPFEIGADDAGLLIYTDIAPAYGKYIKNQKNTSLYPPDFTLALSYYLAMLIAPRITAGDEFGVSRKLAELYRVTMSGARANAANESQRDEWPDAESIRAR